MLDGDWEHYSTKKPSKDSLLMRSEEVVLFSHDFPSWLCGLIG